MFSTASDEHPRSIPIKTHIHKGPIIPPVFLGLRLQRVYHAAWQLSPDAEPLEQSTYDQQRRAPSPHLRVRRQEPHGHRRCTHAEQAEHQGFLPSTFVPNVTSYYASQWTHDEGATEYHIAEDEVMVAAVGWREEDLRDGVAEEAVDAEIVPFENVAEGARDSLEGVVYHIDWDGAGAARKTMPSLALPRWLLG